MNSSMSTDELKDLITDTLYEHKAENIVVINLKDKSDIAEYMIIATGRSNKHVSSTAELVIDKVKNQGRKCLVEGMNNSDWVLIDAFDVLVHIFNQEKRELYALEKLWQG